jgi:hypothetical protein
VEREYWTGIFEFWVPQAMKNREFEDMPVCLYLALEIE